MAVPSNVHAASVPGHEGHSVTLLSSPPSLCMCQFLSSHPGHVTMPGGGHSLGRAGGQRSPLPLLRVLTAAPGGLCCDRLCPEHA